MLSRVELAGMRGAVTLRRCSDCEATVGTIDHPYYTCDYMREFFLTVNPEKGRIILGRIGQKEPILDYTEEPEQILDIKYFGFKTDRDHIAFFVVSNPQLPGCEYITIK